MKYMCIFQTKVASSSSSDVNCLIFINEIVIMYFIEHIFPSFQVYDQIILWKQWLTKELGRNTEMKAFILSSHID